MLHSKCTMMYSKRCECCGRYSNVCCLEIRERSPLMFAFKQKMGNVLCWYDMRGSALKAYDLYNKVDVKCNGEVYPDHPDLGYDSDW